MTLTLLNEWVELQDIDCPPHLRVKRLIDRLGRRTSRCVTPEEADEHEQQEIFDLPHVNKEFTAEMHGVWGGDKWGVSSEEVQVTGKFLEIFGDSSIEWTKPPSASKYIPPSEDIAPYIKNLLNASWVELQEDTPQNREIARQLWNYYGEEKNEMKDIGEEEQRKILLWAERNRPRYDNPYKTDKNPFDEINDSLQDSVSTLGYEKIWEGIREYESNNLGDKPFYQSSIEESLAHWKGNSIDSKQAQVFQEAVSYLFSGRKDRFFEEYKELGEKKNEQLPQFNPDLKRTGDSMGEFSAETLEYQVEAVKIMIAKERELWKSLIGDKPIRVYRGIAIYDKDAIHKIGATQSHDFPLSSWSISPSMASGFGSVVLARTITADDIISSFFSMAGRDKVREIDELKMFGHTRPTGFRQGGLLEGEVILYTPEEGSDVEVIATFKGTQEKVDLEREARKAAIEEKDMNPFLYDEEDDDEDDE